MQWLCDDHGKAIEGTYPAIYSSEVKIFHLFCTKFVLKLSQIICILLTVQKIYRIPHFKISRDFEIWRVYRVLGRVSYLKFLRVWEVKFYRVLKFVYPVKFYMVYVRKFMSNFQFYRVLIFVTL